MQGVCIEALPEERLKGNGVWGPAMAHGRCSGVAPTTTTSTTTTTADTGTAGTDASTATAASMDSVAG